MTGPLLRTDWEAGSNPSTAIVEATAAATDRDDLEVDVLNAYLDPDALDTLLTSATDAVTVSFEYDGVVVSIATDGTLEIWPGAGY